MALAKFSSDRGNVTIEFIGIVVALFIPISYISIAALRVSTAFIDMQNAARAGTRVFVTSANDSDAKQKSTAVIRSILADGSNTKVMFACSNDPCLSLDGTVEVTLHKNVDLGLPGIFAEQSINLSANQLEVVQAIR